MAPPAVVVSTATRGAPCADRADRRAAHQRQRLDQRLEAFDPRDAAIGEERARHIVLAGERAGVGDGKLARRRRAAELVGDDRLAARRRAEREFAQRRPHCGSIRGTAGSRRCRDRRACTAQISPTERSTSLPIETSPAKPTPARLAARHQRADHGAGVRGKEGAADRNVRLGEGRVGGEQQAFAQVHDAEARRADDAGCRFRPRPPSGAARAPRRPRRFRRSRRPGWWRPSRRPCRIRRPRRSRLRSAPGYRRARAPRAAPRPTGRRARPAPSRALH